MKSLGIFNNPSECKQIRDLLESRGIPTDLNTGSFAGRGALLVCINEQYEDALALLENPEHVVAEPVDVAQFRQAVKTQGLGTILKGGIAVLIFLLAILGALIAVHFYG